MIMKDFYTYTVKILLDEGFFGACGCRGGVWLRAAGATVTGVTPAAQGVVIAQAELPSVGDGAALGAGTVSVGHFMRPGGWPDAGRRRVSASECRSAPGECRSAPGERRVSAVDPGASR